ncbi:MAG: radical SAM protein, partial [bacterium]|nr:radical SAM protein [bacterium]
MKSCSILESKKRNKYFYDRKKKKAQLCHPLLYYFIAKARDAGDGAIDIKDRLSGLKDGESVEIEDYGCFSKKEIQYYYQKYMFLKQSDYFSEINQEELLSARVTGEDIEKVVANCPQVVFEVTEQCQMNCDYCGYGEFYHTVGRDERKSMDTGYAKTMLDYLLEKWNSPLNASHDSDIRIGFYGGEPLLNMPFIREIIDYTKGLKLLHNHFIYTMTTNGLLLDKHMDLLVENDFHLLISLDGDEANNAYRVFKNGKPTYDNIMKNIKALQMKSPRYFRDRVNFNVVLHNKNSVAAVYNFFKREFGIIPIIGELN